MDFNQTSFLFSSPNPEKLAKFYSLLIGHPVLNGYSSEDFLIPLEISMRMTFFKPSENSYLSKSDPPSISICFQKKPSQDPLGVLENIIPKIKELGGILLGEPKLESFGAEAWFSDIEDNKFLIFVPFSK
ncbi:MULTISPECIES: glyoxalase/bleomycin resistance/dioxygenase family protein [unclassified Prochlorococcus]|uniref:glyoxalase/bleomycin resistance/dioxygenase family protein n=1 Tax=unclassified Prochlorococcus TaxID=2627481 RepID=UPI0005337E6B|nr:MULTISPECIES: glyoxalase/bleomycin resistance/dioxygenase family protein [unclassified Prochlorococcus]KGG15342.1 Lactoylglutathione lyase family enzyme [Prochlorococcus sp. MIT 0602]KGG17620.1 Lactoylglutathione lyase family enzyme [Prochlorococcus sp. MIT 0603]